MEISHAAFRIALLRPTMLSYLFSSCIDPKSSYRAVCIPNKYVYWLKAYVHQTATRERIGRVVAAAIGYIYRALHGSDVTNQLERSNSSVERFPASNQEEQQFSQAMNTTGETACKSKQTKLISRDS